MLIIKKTTKQAQALINILKTRNSNLCWRQSSAHYWHECDHAGRLNSFEVDSSASKYHCHQLSGSETHQVLSYTACVVVCRIHSDTLFQPPHEPQSISKKKLLGLFPFRDAIHCWLKPDGHYDNEFFGKKKHQHCQIQTPNKMAAMNTRPHPSVYLTTLRESRLGQKWGKWEVHAWKQDLETFKWWSTRGWKQALQNWQTLFLQFWKRNCKTWTSTCRFFKTAQRPWRVVRATWRTESITASNHDLKRYFTEITVKLNAESDDPDDECDTHKNENYYDGKVCSHIVVGGQN